jgi:hypothetical protein
MIKTSLVNGNGVQYSTDTVFKVEVGKGKKSSYRTIREFTGDICNAVLCYRSTPAGDGYKKRLILTENGVSKIIVKELV